MSATRSEVLIGRAGRGGYAREVDGVRVWLPSRSDPVQLENVNSSDYLDGTPETGWAKPSMETGYEAPLEVLVLCNRFGGIEFAMAKDDVEFWSDGGDVQFGLMVMVLGLGLSGGVLWLNAKRLERRVRRGWSPTEAQALHEHLKNSSR